LIDVLTAESDPVLAELWDNEDDVIYDELEPVVTIPARLPPTDVAAPASLRAVE
jgi:hypothetical protein